MEERSSADRIDTWKRLLTISWALVGLAVLIAGALWLLGRVTGALTPFVLAVVVVLLLRRSVTRLEKAGLSRTVSVGICYLVSAVLLTIVVVFVVPPIIAEIRDFSEDFPRYYDAAYGLWSEIESDYLAIELPGWVSAAAEASRESIVASLTEASRNIARAVVTVGGQIIGFFVNVFLALALAFFVLRDLPTIKTELLALPGPARREESFKLAQDVTLVLEGFIRGQLIIATIVGVLTGLGLSVLGVPYALVIGLIAGVTNLIPYLGPIVGGIIAAISAAFVGPELVVWTVVWVVIVQQAESLFLQPRIMSDQVHMHPVLVILSLLIGATLFGLIGMLLAVPVAAVSKVLFIHFYEKWTESSISADDGALFRKLKRRKSRKGYETSVAVCVNDDDATEEGHELPHDDASEGVPREGS